MFSPPIIESPSSRIFFSQRVDEEIFVKRAVGFDFHDFHYRSELESAVVPHSWPQPLWSWRRIHRWFWFCHEANCDCNIFSAVLLIVCEWIPEEFLLSTSENVDCLAMFSTNNIIDRLSSWTADLGYQHRKFSTTRYPIISYTDLLSL